MKKPKILRATRKELFKVENLEPRILLSADPIAGMLADGGFIPDTNPQKQTINLFENQSLSTQAKQTSLENVALRQTIPTNKLTLDIEAIAKNRSALSSDLVISNNEILGGNGSLDLNVINKGIVSPGHSPGIQTFQNFTQDTTGLLEIQLGGTSAGTAYDQLNISGKADLGGLLSISLIDNFQPKIGDTFDILKFGSVQGSFEGAKGLYGFNSDYYFDLVQTPTSLQLVVKEFVAGDGFSILSNQITQNDALGELFNYDYFSKSARTVELDGAVNLSGSVNLAGHFSFGLQNTNTNYTLNDNSKVAAETWIFSARNTQGFLGINGGELTSSAKGLLFSDVDLGLAFINPVDNADERSWVMAKGTMGGLSFNALPDFTVSASDFAIDFSEGLGIDKNQKANQTVLNLATTPITVKDSNGELAKFNDDGKLGEHFEISGTAQLKISEFNVSGNFGFSKNANQIDVSGSNINAGFSTSTASIGIENGSLGLVITENGSALEATGKLASKLGDSIVLSADTASIRWNQTGLAFTDKKLSNYQFIDLPASKTLQEVKVSKANVNVAQMFQASGDFTFYKNASTVKLSDGKNVAVDVLTLGTTGVSAFAGANGGTATELGLKLSNTDFSLALFSETAKTSARSWAALKANSSSVQFVGDSDLTISAKTISVEINLQDATTKTVLDFNAQAMQIGDISFDFDGSKGEIIRASGSLDIAVAGYFLVKGDFAFEKSSQELTLSDGKKITATALTVSGINASAFAGIGGETPEKMGLNLEKVDFALAMFANSAAPTEHWTALKATAGSVELVGVSEVMISAKTISVEINLQDATTKTVLDFNAQAMQIGDISFDFDGSKGEIIRAAGELSINVANFFAVNGKFGFEKSTEKLTLSDGKTVDANALKLGATGVSAFAGLNGDSENPLGFVLDDVDFGLALLSDSQNAARRWTALQANAKSVAFVGVDDVSIAGKTLNLAINTADSEGLVVDFSKQNLKIATDSTSDLTLDMDGKQGKLLRATGEFNLNLANFFSVSGSFAFEKSSREVTLSDQSKVQTDTITFGGSNLDAFAGLNGNFDAKMGFELASVNFGLALLSEQKNNSHQWVSLQASAEKVGFVGIDGFTVSAKKLTLNYNQADEKGIVVDYAAQPFEIATGSENASITLDMDGSKGALIQAVGQLDINVMDFFQVSGEFAFEKSTQEVTLSDQSKVTTDLLTVGGHNVSAFAGLNGNSDAKMGLEVKNIDFALALLTDQNDTARRWLSLKTNAGAAAFIGVEGLTVAANNLFVEVNQSIGKDSDVTVSATGKKIVTEKTNTILKLDVTDSAGEIEFSYKNQSATVNLNQSDKLLASQIKLKFESFAGIGQGNVKVSGTKTAGFNIEFIGELAGQAIENVEIKTISPEISVDISEQKTGETHVETTQNGQDANEKQVLTFNGLQAGKGSFTLTFEGKTTADIAFAGSDSAKNAQNIQTALETLANIGAGNVIVNVAKDFSINRQRYLVEFTGKLARKNVDALSVNPKNLTITTFETGTATAATNEQQEIRIQSTLTTATNEKFTLKFNGKETDSIGFATTATASNATHIQDALEKLVGKNNVSVVWMSKDANGKNTLTNDQRFTVTFKNNQGNQNVSQLEIGSTAKLSNLNLSVSTIKDGSNGVAQTNEISTPIADVKTASITVETTQDGAAAEIIENTIKNNEVQRIKINATTDGTFILALKNQGKTLTTNALPLDISAADLQTALTTAFAAKIDVSQSKTGEFLVSFAGDFAGQNVELLTVTTKSAVKEAVLAVSQLGETTEKTVAVETSTTKQVKLVVDYSTQPLVVKTGVESAITFDMKGEVLRASGSLDIAVAGYFLVKGDFAFEKSSQELTLSDGKKITATALTVSGINASAFAGIGGDTPAEMGLKLGEVDFALAMFANSAAPTEHWTTLKATAGSVELVGVSEVTISAQTISVEINLADATTKTVIDFNAQAVQIGDISFDFDGSKGEIIRAAGSLDIAVAGYFLVKGDFAFEKSSQELTLSDGKKITATALTVSGINASAFAGIGG
ncbi:MAG: LEPR-XLL domain-containing protein, partial [Methylococcales bacterium]|nr:LEPR-XLL domain-containing protein [Methylococcales bacterium]